jgi:hypothetical protein
VDFGSFEPASLNAVETFWHHQYSFDGEDFDSRGWEDGERLQLAWYWREDARIASG